MWLKPKAEGTRPVRFGSTGAKISATTAEEDGALEDSEMAYAPTKLGQDPKYEPFLQAPVGDDHRGTSVTVLSMFARLGVDPWCEASDLASLPDGAARQRLEALMARFHDVSTQVADRGSIISRLLAFLPRQGKSVIPSSDSVSSTLAVPPQGSRFYWIVAAAFFLGWIIMLAQGQ